MIYRQTPYFEKCFVFPYVCKKWEKASKFGMTDPNEREQKVQQYARSIISGKYCYQPYAWPYDSSFYTGGSISDYAGGSISDILKLSRGNQLFTSLQSALQPNSKFFQSSSDQASPDSRHVMIRFSDKEITVKRSLHYLCSKFFNIFWSGNWFWNDLLTPKSEIYLKEKNIWGEKSIRVQLHVKKECLFYNKNRVPFFTTYAFRCSVNYGRITTKALLFRCLDGELLDTTTTRVSHNVTGAFMLSFLANIDFLARRNIAKLSSVKSLRELLDKGLFCKLGSLGNIIDTRSSRKEASDIKFEIFKIEKNCEIIRWQSENWGENAAWLSLNETIRYLVLTRTASKLEQVFKIKVNRRIKPLGFKNLMHRNNPRG